MRVIDPERRAQLFTELAAMEGAGLPPARAFSVLGERAGAAGAAARRCARSVARGVAVASAARASGLFDELDARLVAAAAQFGSPESAYRRLAAFHGERARRRRAVRARLALPVFILVAALFLVPLPALVAGRLGAGGYLAQSAGPLLLLLALAAALRLPHRLRGLSKGGLAAAIDGIALQLPVIGRYLRRREVVGFLETLALALDAGTPAMDAVPLAAEAVDNRVMRARGRAVAARLEAGDPFERALAAHPDLDARALQYAASGGATGDPAASLEHYLRWERRALADHAERIAEWVPRVIYVAILVWVGWRVVGGWLPLLHM